MEEIEVPIEGAQEEIRHHAHHGDGPSWTTGVALSSSLLAVVAAIAALMAGHDANEAMISQIKASDTWSYFQAKGIKAAILEGRLENGHMEPAASESAREKVAEYKHDQEETKKEAEALQTESQHFLTRHEALAQSVTFFQVAIALSAISVLARRKRIWQFSLGLALIGVVCFARAFLRL